MNTDPNPSPSLTEILYALILACIPFFETLLARFAETGRSHTPEARRVVWTLRCLRIAAARLGAHLDTPDAPAVAPIAPISAPISAPVSAPINASHAPHPRRRPAYARPRTPVHCRIAGPAHAAIAFQARRPGITPAPARTLEL